MLYASTVYNTIFQSDNVSVLFLINLMAVELLRVALISSFISPHTVPSALQDLIDHIDRDLTFALETEHGTYERAFVCV